MTNYKIELNNLVKFFGRRLVFDGIDFTFTNPIIYGISGPNGSGKSTLIKIISDLISPTRGKVIHSLNDKIVVPDELHNYIGFVSPYLSLYDEFTAEENLLHFSNIRGLKFNKERSDYLFNEFNLNDRKNDLVRGYSSGMKQRLKFIFALLHTPPLLLLDEPTSNLDNPGKEIAYKIINNESKNRLSIIASNEDSDLALCSKIINLQEYKERREK